MSYRYSFADNETYSAEDLNKFFSRIVSSGIEEHFDDGVPYNLSKINDAGACIYTDGVVPETELSLKVIKNGDKAEILPGAAFFKDGAVIEIYETESLDIISGVKNYVYLKNDLEEGNACYPEVSDEEPSENFVLLCEINGETVTDMRKYAKGKLPFYSSNAFYKMEISDDIHIINDKAEESKTYDIGNNTFGHILAVGKDLLGIYEINSGKYLSFAKHSEKSNCLHTDKLCMWHGSYYELCGKITLSEGKLSVSFTFSNTADGYFEGVVPITLYLF